MTSVMGTDKTSPRTSFRILPFARTLSAVLFSGAIVLGAAGFPSQVQAGFEWTPPPETETRKTPVIKAAPSPSGAQGDLAIDAYPMGDDEAVMKLKPIGAVESEPLASPKTMMPVPTEKTEKDYKIAEGFGRDIALALAMRQIVPEDYAYSFDPGVDPGMRVSWDGGKPWTEVLEDAVLPHDLAVVVSDKTAWVLPGEKVADYKKRVRKSQAGAASTATAMKDPLKTSRVKDPVFPGHDIDKPATGAEHDPLLDTGSGPIPLTPAPGTAKKNRVAPTPSVENKNRQMQAGMIESERRTYRDIGLAESDYNPSYPRRTPPGEKSGMEERGGTHKSGTTGDIHIDWYKSARTDTGTMRAGDMTSTTQSAAPYDVRSWQAAAGASLRDVLSEWSDEAGVEFIWNTDVDYRLPRSINTNATYPDIVSRVLTIYTNVEPRPRGRLHTNTGGQPALVVSSKG